MEKQKKVKKNEISEMLLFIFNKMDKFEFVFHKKQKIKILNKKDLEKIIEEMDDGLYTSNIIIINKTNDKPYILEGLDILFNLYLYYLGYSTENKSMTINRKKMKKEDTLLKILKNKKIKKIETIENQKIKTIENQKIKMINYYYNNSEELYSLLKFQKEMKMNNINLNNLKKIILDEPLNGGYTGEKS